MGRRSFFIAGGILAAFFALSPAEAAFSRAVSAAIGIENETNASGGAITAKAAENEYYIGGMPAGFTLGLGGVQVIGLSSVTTESGAYSPAGNAGIVADDVIERVAGKKVTSTAELNAAIEQSGGKRVSVEIRRKGESAQITLTPVKDRISGKYKIGVLVRDCVTGIGTITYIEKDGRRFGALGHAVSGENAEKYTGGEICSCTIVGVMKGTRGKAGELRGTLLNAEKIGAGNKVTDCGIFGTIDEMYALNGNLTAYAARAEEVKIGDACIYSTIEGDTPQKFEIDIVKVDKNNKSNKNFVIKITDSALIEKTGGIVQGMSGSPIVQNGKIVGAVTHVFINDPQRGYGVSMENMLKSAT